METEQQLAWATAWVVREARESMGLTQSQLAGFAGLSDAYIASLEQAATGISIASLVQIAVVLRIRASELMLRIEKEMERGPRNPARSPGRPRKQKEIKPDILRE